ncbi:hypothetical protein Agau_L101448 [Agrobacterium tumefaciens F2]|nr:hypothetical protein Agau_L101448 [Agrobacterium tumefaciens F2]
MLVWNHSSKVPTVSIFHANDGKGSGTGHFPFNEAAFFVSAPS